MKAMLRSDTDVYSPRKRKGCCFAEEIFRERILLIQISEQCRFVSEQARRQARQRL